MAFTKLTTEIHLLLAGVAPRASSRAYVMISTATTYHDARDQCSSDPNHGVPLSPYLILA